MASRIRNRFTDEEVKYAINKGKRQDGSIDYRRMSNQLSNNPHGTRVSPELCRYWAKQFEKKTKGGNDFRTLTQANRDIKNERVLREPSRYEDAAITPLPEVKNEAVLVIPDLHAPYHHPDTLDFLSAVSDAFDVDSVVSLGDETDKHAMSFHDSDPNLDSAGKELEQARKFLFCLHELFPAMKVCHSNHGSMLYRKANSHGIPIQYLKTYREVLFPNGGGEQWDWAYSHVLDLPNGEQVLFKHQPAGSAILDAAHEGMNLVVGHLHGKFNIEFAKSAHRQYWAVQGGCLIDNDSLAFAYGKESKNKPILGVTVILDSIPTLIPMRLNNQGRWVGTV